MSYTIDLRLMYMHEFKLGYGAAGSTRNINTTWGEREQNSQCDAGLPNSVVEMKRVMDRTLPLIMTN